MPRGNKLFIINDSTNNDIIHPKGKRKGLNLPPEGERSYAGVAQPFPKELLVPRSEWQARIQEMNDRKATTRHLAKQRGWKVKNQASTNYCWINAPTAVTELKRLKQNQKHVVLSPASAGARIKNFRNVGGWGREGIEFIVTNGLVPVDKWPANAISKTYNTPENQKLALDYRVDEWYFLTPRSLDEQVSAILRGFDLAGGFNWWGHEVSLVGLRWLDGEVATDIANSWDVTWGDEGYGTLQGDRQLSDDTVTPRSVIAA